MSGLFAIRRRSDNVSSHLLLIRLVVLLWASLVCADGARLYVLTGTPVQGQDLPVSLYNVDAEARGPAGAPIHVADGITCVLSSPERELLAVVTPSLAPKRLIVIDGKAPSDTRTVDLKYEDRLPLGLYLVDLPNYGLNVAFALGKLWEVGHEQYPDGFVTGPLTGASSPTTIPFEDLRYLRSYGAIGGAVSQPACAPSLMGQPLGVFVAPRVRSIDVPPPIYFQSRAKESYSLIESSDNFVAIKTNEPNVIDVYDRNVAGWRRVPVPFADGIYRGFGKWLAAVAVSRSDRKSVV